ncbi:MAG: M28 family peptidase [Planctomycetota bacterium]|nr:M28 family peptidase [Planctomycetota bacterium]
MKHGPFLGTLGLLLTACAAGEQRVVEGVPRTRPSAEAPRLASDVAWLAADEREGRRAGTPGEEAAAGYIARRLFDLGLEPAGEGGWLQEFDVPLPPRDGGGSSIGWWGPATATSGPEPDEVTSYAADLIPLFCSARGRAEGPVGFCGYGILNEDLGRDDFGDRGYPGIAVVVRGVPPFESAAEDGGWADAGSLFLKVMNARRKGYTGVLIVQHPDRADEPLPIFDTSRGAVAGVPAMIVSAAFADRLFGYTERVRALATNAERGEDVTLPHLRVRMDADVVRESGRARNVLGRIPGRDAAKTVVIGAHFDHLGRGGPGSLAPDQQGAIHNGADDNASGTAAVLEMARILAAGPPPEGDVVIALWSGEELGLLGSEHWMRNPTVPLERVIANLNLDMVGRAGDGALQVLGAGTSPAFAGWMAEAGSRAGLELEVNLSGSGLGGSDHQVFLKRKIPALHLFTGVHTDYHKPTDDFERFEADGARRVVELGLHLVDRMQAADELSWSDIDPEAQPPRERGWSVWFGTVPEYAGDQKGLLLAGTSAGSPAEKAGLLAGDLIVQVGDVEIETIHDFVYFLQIHKPGDVVLARFIRAGAEHRVRITLATREAE